MNRKFLCLLSFCLMAGLVSSASAWTGVTIGDDLPLGSNTYDAATGTWTILGDGHDIWDNADDFRYVYKYLTGDGSLSARVVSMGPGSNTWAKAGVMMRESLAAGSRHAMQCMTDTEGGGASWQQRQSTNGGGTNTDNGTGVAEPYYVKIERTGDDFRGYLSADGVTWAQQGSAITMNFREKTGTIPACYIGLCVTSHATGELREAKFDNVVMTGNITDAPPAILKAWAPDPANGSTSLTMGLFRWTKGDTAVFHKVYFGTDPNALTEVTPPNYPYAYYYYAQPLVPGTTYYWRVDEVEAGGKVNPGDVWSAMATPLTAYQPIPADGAENVSTLAALAWSPGRAAFQHHVYLGTDRTAVENGEAAADKGLVDTPSFDAGMLRAMTTYHWRVDEIEAIGTVHQGSVWSFSTGGEANKILWQWWLNIAGTAVSDLATNANYPANPSGSRLVDLFESDVDWADNYGQRLCGWLKPPQDGDYTFWIAGDDAQQLWLSTDVDPANVTMIASVPGWTPARDFDNTGGGTGDATLQKSAAIPLLAGQKYYIEALGKEGGGGDSTAVAWQGPGIGARAVIEGKYVDTFGLPPLQPFGPSPANGAVDVIQSPTLTWGAGDLATSHELYFGDDANAVAAADTTSPLFVGSLADASYALSNLQWNKTYYWKVDEVNPAEPDSPWKGGVWSFTTANYSLIDDFERYDDNIETGTTIYDTWVDGLTDGRTTSQVGYWDPPFCEQTIIHGGKQSMPLNYDNALSPYFAEVQLGFSPLENWTTNGVTDLSLWVHGGPTNYLKIAEDHIAMSGGGADIWGATDEFRYAYKTLTGNGSIVTRVCGFGPGTNNWAKGGVMIRETLDGDSKHMMMVLTGGDGSGIAFQGRQDIAGNSSGMFGDITAAPPYWVKLTREGNTITAYISPDGAEWMLFTDASPDNAGGVMSNPIDVTMANTVYIGLAVTSHEPTELRGFEFSNIATTGNVTGAWTVTDIGVDQGTGPSNAVDPVYLVVEETPAKVAIVKHPDPYKAVSLEWTEWKIPLSSLTGINKARIQSLYIGVGDRKAPVPSGGGLIYIDDIRVVKPAP